MLVSCYTAMPDERIADVVHHMLEDCTHLHATP